ncbi:MAG: DNA mismatch repair endonuclease MutL [Syntrophomonadaceae bacterium]
MSIKLLDESLINKIAAGEVVERPASVVKELLENSLDAGASRIDIRISGGGIEYIEVSDDGVGIGEADLPLAFLRHATSKISGEEDLFQIRTMGFRGEALPSIASVSRMEIFTRWGDEAGIYMRLEGGRVAESKHLPGPPGTKIIIKDLFFNTPARKKFLRSAVSEGNQVYDLICRYALARSDVSFSFSNDKRTFFKTPGSSSLSDTVLTVWSRELGQHLLEVDSSFDSYGLKGLVSSAELHRQSRKNQLFFVNRRPVKSPLVYRALDLAYQGMLLAREQPLAILHLNLPEDEVDVNVHPQKNEVRFRDEKRVFTTLVEGLREALGEMKVGFNMPSRDRNPVDYRPAALERPPVLKAQPGIPFIWKDTIIKERPVSDLAGGDEFKAPMPPDPGFRIIGQCLDSYIILEKEQALFLVDQHAAHERIMYHRLKSAVRGSSGQILAIPLAIELNRAQMNSMENQLDKLEKLGFRLEPLGPNSMLIREAPSLLVGREIEVLLELADLPEIDRDDYEHAALSTMACKKAVKNGTSLLADEMTNIIQELFKVPDYRFCPHGRPTMIMLSKYELDRMFKR